MLTRTGGILLLPFYQEKFITSLGREKGSKKRDRLDFLQSNIGGGSHSEKSGRSWPVRGIRYRKLQLLGASRKWKGFCLSLGA